MNESDRRPPFAWLADRNARVLLVLLVLGGVGLWLATRDSFFYADDYLNFALAHQLGFSFAYLKLSYFGNFAPGHRVLDYLVAGPVGLSWGFALSLWLGFWVASVIAFYVVARELFGATTLALVTTALFATSPAYVRLLQWWSSAGHVVPGICFTLVALAGALRWERTRTRSALAVALGGYAAGLLFYAKPLLLALYVVGLLYFVRAPSLRASDLVGRVRRDAMLLVGLAALAVGYVIVLRVGHYDEGGSVPLRDWQEYLRLAWSRGVTPLVIGQSVPARATAFNEVARILAQVALALLVLVSLALRRSAWRAWLFYGVVWAANVVAVGYARLPVFGPGIGYDLRYNAEFAFLIPLAIGLALDPREPDGQPRRGWLPTAERALGNARHAIARAGGLAALAVLAAVFVASLVTTFHRVDAAWPAPRARDYAARAHSSAQALRRRGIAPSVIDGSAPRTVVAGERPPYSLLSSVLPLIDPGLPVDDPRGGTLTIVARNGTLHAATLMALTGATALELSARHQVATVKGRPGQPRSGTLCESAGASPTLVQWNVVGRPAPPGARALFQAELAPLTAPARIWLYLDAGRGYPVLPTAKFSLRSGDRFVRYPVPGPSLVRARLDLQPRSAACLRRVATIAYR